MTAASRERLGNGTSSVMHSRISIANENVSEWIVAERSPFLRSSGAEYLTKPPDATVIEIVLSLTSSTILAIPKSQTCGSPLPVCGQPLVCGSDVNVGFTSGETSTFFYVPSVNRVSQGGIRGSRI